MHASVKFDRTVENTTVSGPKIVCYFRHYTVLMFVDDEFDDDDDDENDVDSGVFSSDLGVNLLLSVLVLVLNRMCLGIAVLRVQSNQRLVYRLQITTYTTVDVLRLPLAARLLTHRLLLQ